MLQRFNETLRGPRAQDVQIRHRFAFFAGKAGSMSSERYLSGFAPEIRTIRSHLAMSSVR